MGLTFLAPASAALLSGDFTRNDVVIAPDTSRGFALMAIYKQAIAVGIAHKR